VQNTSREVVRTATMSSGVAVALIVVLVGFGAALLVILEPGFGYSLNDLAIVAPLVFLYPLVVGTLVNRSRSELAVPGVGAVLPAIVAAALAVHPPYTGRDVAAPLAIGIIALVGIWISAAVLERVPVRKASWTAILVIGVVAVIAWFFASVLLLQTNAAPF
jgi:hypothetical protein